MTIDPVTGLITWATTQGDVGHHAVTVRATDPYAAWGKQSFDLHVKVNAPPEIVSSPVTETLVELPYTYQVEVTDPDDTEFTYVLDQAPTGMAIDAQTGEVSWTPAAGQEGDHDVVVVVRDVLLAEDAQAYTLTVLPVDADVFRPEVLVTCAPKVVDPGEPVTIAVQATDDFGVASLELTVNGVPVALDDADQAVYTPSTNGVYIA
jgi:hypothetical protein